MEPARSARANLALVYVLQAVLLVVAVTGSIGYCAAQADPELLPVILEAARHWPFLVAIGLLVAWVYVVSAAMIYAAVALRYPHKFGHVFLFALGLMQFVSPVGLYTLYLITKSDVRELYWSRSWWPPLQAKMLLAPVLAPGLLAVAVVAFLVDRAVDVTPAAVVLQAEDILPGVAELPGLTGRLALRGSDWKVALLTLPGERIIELYSGPPGENFQVAEAKGERVTVWVGGKPVTGLLNKGTLTVGWMGDGRLTGVNLKPADRYADSKTLLAGLRPRGRPVFDP